MYQEAVDQCIMENNRELHEYWDSYPYDLQKQMENNVNNTVIDMNLLREYEYLPYITGTIASDESNHIMEKLFYEQYWEEQSSKNRDCDKQDCDSIDIDDEYIDDEYIDDENNREMDN